ncbi:MAG: 30S ribosomal protein S6 [bacterium]|nr:30S ribosomal protein S6 [bacterium]
MKKYELTTITLKEDEADKVASLIQELGGKIEDRKDLGNRRFAYPINKEASGIYTAFTFSLDEQKITELNKKLTGNSDIIRHLIIITKEIKKEFISKLSEELSKKTAEKTGEEALVSGPVEKEEKPEETKEAKTEKEKPAVISKAKEPELKKPEEKQPEAETEKVELKEATTEEKQEEKPTEKPKTKEPEAKSEEEERLKKLNEKLDELLKD